MKLGVFIDYDNLLEPQKALGIHAVTTKALILSPLGSANMRGVCDVRVYGGWYEGLSITQRAQDVSVSIQAEFPTIIRLPQNLMFSANAELAMSMLEEPSHHLFNTYRKKGKPGNIRVQAPASVGCVDAACPLTNTRKLLKTGRCPINSCSVSSTDLVYRHEQKIVDTMLSCDLIYAANLGYDRLILISGDDDFLPPLRTILLRGTPVLRFHPKPNQQRASFPTIGAPFLEIDL